MFDRTAESTIKGFLYQFNKTICEILNAEIDAEVSVDGLIEDIDILSANGQLTAIQCKYHASKDKYVDSLIFKPLLQMAEGYDKNPVDSIKYIIFMHIPGEDQESRSVDVSVLEAALSTSDKKLKKIAEKISSNFNKSEFLKKVSLSFGPALDDLERKAKENLALLNISGADVETLLYPNAIAKISKLSSLSDERDRKITRKRFSDYLASANFIAISKWTLALRNKAEILKLLRKQLSSSFSQNSRDRYFFIEKKDIQDYESQVVVFLTNYVKKYGSKPTHINVPTFAINDTFDAIQELEHRLYKKNIKVNTGLVGATFEVEYFYRNPLIKIARSKIEDREFDLRLLAMKSEPDAINYRKGDDLYIVSSISPESIDLEDVNFYQIGIGTFNELEYVISMRDSYE